MEERWRERDKERGRVDGEGEMEREGERERADGIGNGERNAERERGSQREGN